MNRDFLRGLGLEDEQVNAIMGRHGSTIAEKEDEIGKLNKQIEDLKGDVADLKDGGDEDLKEQLATFEKDKQSLEQQLSDQSRQHKLERYVDSLGTKDATYIMAKLEDVELEDDEFVDIDKRVEELKEAHPLLFEADEPKEPVKPKAWAQGNSTVGDNNQPNPFSKEHWNLTEQGRLYKEEPELYNTMKAQAGK